MDRDEVYKQYGVMPAAIQEKGRNTQFTYQNRTYLYMPIGLETDQDVQELYYLCEYMKQMGDRRVASFVLTKDQHLVGKIKGKKVVLFRYANHTTAERTNVAKELAQFHKIGRSFPYKVSARSRIGQWKDLWGKRLDQMEIFWQGKVKQHPSSSFERLFVESFPYYLGLTENAIQYIVDTEIDERPATIDAATICHHRFSMDTWKNTQDNKIPLDWVFDHCSRDLAELIRAQFLETEALNMSTFQNRLYEYNQVSPLSRFSWRLLYARLLFPVHFFDCIEEYYLNERNQEWYEQRLHTMLSRTEKHEHLLANYPQIVNRITNHQYKLPTIDWLVRR